MQVTCTDPLTKRQQRTTERFNLWLGEFLSQRGLSGDPDAVAEPHLHTVRILALVLLKRNKYDFYKLQTLFHPHVRVLGVREVELPAAEVGLRAVFVPVPAHSPVQPSTVEFWQYQPAWRESHQAGGHTWP